MSVAVVVAAVPLLLLAGVGLEWNGQPDAAVERLLRDELHRSAWDAGFAERRQMAVRMAQEASARLRRDSPLFSGARLLLEGSAFEGGHSVTADVDTFLLLPAGLLESFEVRHAPDGGGFTVSLRPGRTRRALPAQLASLVTDHGHLSALRFKRWGFGQMEAALRWSAAAVYQSGGAVGADVVGADGAVLPLDFTPLLAAPPAAAGFLRPTPLRHCGLPLPPDPAAPWYLYSAPAAAGQQHTFSGDLQSLETRLLRRRPALRRLLRLLKLLSAGRRWKHTYHLKSFHLKMALLWSFSAGCGGPDWGDALLPPILATLRTLHRATLRGRLDNFWFRQPAQNVLTNVADRPSLADELGRVIDTLQSAEPAAIGHLFHG